MSDTEPTMPRPWTEPLTKVREALPGIFPDARDDQTGRAVEVVGEAVRESWQIGYDYAYREIARDLPERDAPGPVRHGDGTAARREGAEGHLKNCPGHCVVSRTTFWTPWQKAQAPRER